MTEHRRNKSLNKLFRLWQKHGWIFIPVFTGWWEKTEKISRKKMKRKERKDKKKFKMRYRDMPFQGGSEVAE